MMKCLFGIYHMDEGDITLDGREISFSGPKDALENGVAMVHQELNQCLDRSVVDNLFLGRYPTNGGVIDEGRMKKEAAELFRTLGMTVNLTQPMRKMSVSARQMCEIAKAISYNSKIIVLDEPTKGVDVGSKAQIYQLMSDLASQGMGILMISSEMPEVMNMSDRIYVMSEGHITKEFKAEGLTQEEILTAAMPAEREG
jgi:methyl-galactoside transport system ATP-binding protein